MQLPHQLLNDPVWPLLLHISNFSLGVQAGRGTWSAELGHMSMPSCKGGWENEYLAILASILNVGYSNRLQMFGSQK